MASSKLRGAMNKRLGPTDHMVPVSAPDEVMVLLEPAPPVPADLGTPPEPTVPDVRRPLRAAIQGELGTKPGGPTQEYSVDGLRGLLERVNTGTAYVLSHLDNSQENRHAMALLSDLMTDCDGMLVAHLTALVLNGRDE